MSIPLPKLSPKKRGWVSGDPPVGARGRSSSQRKSARDGGFTPSERRQKDKLMRQFQRMPEGQSGNSTAYTESPLWCAHPGCHRTNGTHVHGGG